MKALNLHGINKLVYEEVQTPKAGEGEVLLKIRACGICSSDEERVLKTGTYHFPTIPGHEFAGEIVEVGTGVEDRYLGKRASVFPLLPCRMCSACEKGEYAMCSSYKYFGSRNDGGFAEYLAVPLWNIILLDDTIDFKVGALMEPAAVALHAVNIGDVKKDDHVAIIGTGTIGILIGAFCKIKGAHVYVCGRRRESLEKAEEFGFETICMNNLSAEVGKATNGERMDIVFEAVGSNEAMESAIMSTSNAGVVVAVGNPKGDFMLSKDVYWKILRWQLQVRGTWNSDYNEKKNDWKEVAELMKENGFPFEKLITKTYNLNEYQKAFDDLTDKTMAKTKLMFVMNEE